MPSDPHADARVDVEDAATGPASALRAAGLRVTGQRVAVLASLVDARDAAQHLSAAQVAAAARSRTEGISTQAVYDCLDALTDAGLVRRIEPAGRPALFEARVGDNHHHLVCRDCGYTVDVDCTHGAAPCLTPDVDHGFVVDEAEVVFWGRCAACAATPSSTGRSPGGPAGAAPRARRQLAPAQARTRH
ncbi:Fur family transcriptional regulator [uncultured Cellulomonas sp.]|uniref:Fur family transcriptional regulator n=1 Tax=uncultured Cellulomonas sp. TaxID=189682 RepID=UPI0026265D6D|nr:Fur family transcriptional regulator [uncultured Cellulomonas sp.]